ncbi:hypothetical protein [Citricoccus sp. GCM10030269]|uniref:hypothetical protein n=1 Tax=Citricoccus sp. GCM10030269 TaxID=3273388 RepID=UPI00360D7A4F
MRVVSGVVALVLGLAAMTGAFGLQTVWAPPATLTASTGAASAAPAEAPLTVITGGIDEVDDKPVEYSLSGEGDYTVMLGQKRDVEAWVGDAAHNTISGIETDVPDGEAPRVVVEHTDGEATVPDPAGSDLWVDVQRASGTIEQRWSVPSEGEWALLVAADGTQPAPTQMSVTWTNTVGDSPWIVPLAIIGALLALIGIALLVWALMIRNRRRNRPAPGTTATASVVALAVVTASLTAPSMVLGASPARADAAEREQYPLVTESQLERILAKISYVVRKGDQEQDVDTLRPRVGSQALQLRSFNYTNRAVSDEVQPQEPVSAGPVVSVLAEADPEFPRTIAAVTEGEGNSTPQFLVLRQNSARDQYRLVANTPMTPGAELPASDLSDTSVESVASDDTTGLAMSPGNAVAGLARYLTDPEADFADRMVENPVIDGVHEYQASVEEDAPDAKMYISRRSVPDASITLRLADGSALVIGHIDARMTIAPRSPGDRIVVDELAAERAGEDSVETTAPVRMTYREVVAVRVPAEGSSGDDAKVSLVGMTDELQAVSFD